jgi:hypothetical protein
MMATELIEQLQAIVAARGDHRVGMTTVTVYSTTNVQSVRFVDGDKLGVPGVYSILIADYKA